MSLHIHVRHCRKCVSLTRPFTDSATRKHTTGNVANMTNKLLRSMTSFKKGKISGQNNWKLVAILKDYVNKSGNNQRFRDIMSKDWLNFLQKATYTQIEAIRKLSLSETHRTVDSDKVSNGEKRKANIQKENKVNLAAGQEESLVQQIVKSDKMEQPTQEQIAADIKIDLREQSYSVSQAVSALLIKLTAKKSSLAPTPKWKVNVRCHIPKHSIASRTRHVLTSITTAESNASRWRRIEDLLRHIDQYPEARHYAIKEGAIPVLLRVRQKSKDEQIKASIREALAVFGYVDPPPGRGIRILSIDGGGIRGVLVLEMLKKLEELTGKKTYEMFDYICGVSTGAILAAALALPPEYPEGGHKRKSLQEISELYKELSTRVFTQSALKGTSSLVWSHAYYDTSLWEKLLQEHLGDKILIKTVRDKNAPMFSAISAVVNHARVMAYVFRNYTLPHRVESQYVGSHKHKLWEAVRASAAAPTYFEEFKYGEYLHQDGGILVNNPCAVAIHEAKQLWPNNPIQCVISFGTGRTPNRICNDEEAMEIALSSWREKFYKILDSATDTEAVHTMLNDLLPDHIYYRFNPYLTEMLSMVEIRPDKISQLEQDAKMYIRRNEEKFEKAAAALSEKRKIQQKLADWIALQKQLRGL